MNLSDLRNLLGGTGFGCLDAAAQAVGKQPLPSEAARPLTSPHPERLQQTQDGWWWAADRLDDHIYELQTAVSSVMANWDAPEEFQVYMTRMMTFLQDQKKAMEEVSKTIEAIRAILQKGKEDTFDQAVLIASALIGVAAGAIAGVVASIFTAGSAAPAVIATAAAAFVGLLVAFLTWLSAYAAAQRSEAEGLGAQLRRLQALVNKDNLPKITPPSMPDLSNVRGFHSIHEPGNASGRA
ncbi:MAG: hypothetical protein ACRDOO_22585 [Actinomadura sp.]